MDRYLVESPHAPGECVKVVQDVHAAGYLNNVDWGCKADVHTAWVIIEAENESQALRVVPSMLRKRARAVRLNKFEPAMVEAWEK